MNKTTKIFSLLTLLLTWNAFADSDPFRSLKYKQKSKIPLSPEERTVNITYPNAPCGTLMSEFKESGSVRLGRGPVYELALAECRKEDSSSYPNDGSVRTFACKNVASKKKVLGNATFAFRCNPGQGDSQVVKAPYMPNPAKLH